jgi:hypothetical protein
MYVPFKITSFDRFSETRENILMTIYSAEPAKFYMILPPGLNLAPRGEL